MKNIKNKKINNNKIKNKYLINNIINKIKKEKNNIKIKEGFFQDKDFFSPTYINLNNPKFLEIDNYFYSGIIITNYFRENNDLILKSLLETNINMNISIFYEKCDTSKVIKELTYNIGNVGAELKQFNDNRQDIDIAAFTYNDAKYIRKEIQINNEEMYFLYIYLNLFSEDKKELKYNIEKIEGILQSRGLQTRRSTFREEQLFISCLPLQENKKEIKELYKSVEKSLKDVIGIIKNKNEMTFNLVTKSVEDQSKIIKEQIIGMSVYNNENKEVYYVNLENNEIQEFKKIFEEEKIRKIGIDLSKTYILLKQENINLKGIYYDIAIASYIINPTNNKLKIEDLIQNDLKIDIETFIGKEETQAQITLFDVQEENNKQAEIKKEKSNLYAYSIGKIKEKTEKELEEIECLDLFYNIDMPTIEVLSNMQWNGMYVDKTELEQFGKELTDKLEVITKIIYEMAGEEFNINSTKQLGEILFEKMKLPVVKKTKSGYSTDVDVLEKLKKEDPIIEQILEYRQLMKLNSTYVEGLKQYINPETKRIHSFFHQTITATGRISSTEPNLQNIPTRFELGKRVRKVFKPQEGCVYIDADYSQIELRVLASISEDSHMIEAFKEGQDIHKQAASKVFKTPIDEVTKEQRSNAKAVNFGIVYGISDFGLGEQLGIGRKQAKKYIDEYLTQYSGINQFMDNIKEEAKEKGYVKTLFNRRRYIPELKSNNYMVRQFGARAAMNTPIQGTAADIMKIAMLKVFKEIEKRGLKSKIVLQVHDEMMLEVPIGEQQEIQEIMKKCMESAADLKVPLVAEISEANNWYDCK